MPTHDFKDIGDVLNFQLLKGIITAIDSATDTCTVSVGGDTLEALLYYHCTPTSELRDNGAISGAAAGFKEGDEVIVLINSDKTSIKVIGHTDGIRRCEEEGIGGEYYIFYISVGNLRIAKCAYSGSFHVVEDKPCTEIYSSNRTTPVSFFLKKFYHNVCGVRRELYFVATSLYINPNPYQGWVNFVAANPTFPLVTNNANTKIPMTSQLMADLNTVNYNINHAHTYVPEGFGDDWRIMGAGESGDCVANYEEIYTKEGIKKVGDLKVGDIVLSYDFKAKQYVYKPITKIWEKGLLPGVRVGFKNGQSIDITHKHPMWVRTNQGWSHGKREISRYEKRYFKDIDLTRWWKRRVPFVAKLPYEITDAEWLIEDYDYGELLDVSIARQHIKEIGMVEMRDFEVADTHTFIFKNGLIGHNCEDFALTKAQALLNMGYPASAIHVEAGVIEGTTLGHGWLVVQTTRGDYALDISSDSVILNANLRASGGLEYVARRRQIGSNWAFISPFGWMFSSTNQPRPYNTLWYILDPLLNIFYLINPSVTYYTPFLQVGSSGLVSTPSINFSENGIHVARGGYLETYRLEENKLSLMSQVSNDLPGFIGRDGDIVEPATYGSKPVGWPDETIYVEYWDGDGKYHLSYIDPAVQESFKKLYGCEVVSKDGYFEYQYRYITGVIDQALLVHEDDSREKIFLIEWDDLDRPGEGFYWHQKTIRYYDPEENLINCVSDDLIHIRTYIFGSTINKVFGAERPYFFMELLDHNMYPTGHIYYIADYDAYYDIFGLRAPYYTIDPIPTPYDNPYPYLWNHIEVDNEIFFQGLCVRRATDIGDNFNVMYKNGVSCSGEVAAAVGVTETNLLGLAYIPGTNRLN